MATSASRGAQTVNSMYFKPMLRKAFHRKSNSPDSVGDSTKLNTEEVQKNKNNWWVKDDRTGIFYPKGQEKIIEDVPPPSAGKDSEVIHWFSNQDTCI